MTKDDKSLRDTVLAELRRRRALLGESEDRVRGDDGNAERASGANGHGRRGVERPPGPMAQRYTVT
jgi:hypothetical protein